MSHTNTLRTDLPIANQRRAELIEAAMKSFHEAVPLPSLEAIAERWGTPQKTAWQYVDRMRRRGEITTEKRGRRVYVIRMGA